MLYQSLHQDNKLAYHHSNRQIVCILHHSNTLSDQIRLHDNDLGSFVHLVPETPVPVLSRHYQVKDVRHQDG